MKTICFILFCILSISGFGQILSPEAISNGGDYHKNSYASLSWTIGEPLSETYKNPDNTLTQGFQQSHFLLTAIYENENKTLSFNVYPNPTADYINIVFPAGQDNNFNYKIFDYSGQVISNGQLIENSTKIEFYSLPSGVYFFNIEKNNVLYKAFKIVKIK